MGHRGFYSSSEAGCNGCGVSICSGDVKIPDWLVETRPPGVTGASFTTPRPGFFRQPQSSHVNKQMLVFYSLVHSGERGRGGGVIIPTREWLEGTACQLMLHNLPLSLFLHSGLGCQKEGEKGKKRKKKKPQRVSGWVGGGGGGMLVFCWFGCRQRLCARVWSFNII